jgi:hypothetical protein
MLDILRVVHYLDKRILDPKGISEKTSWRDYHTVRNHVVELCRQYGTAGPMGIRNIAVHEDDDEWDAEVDEPDFWIIDDQPNYERYIYIEICSKKVVTFSWFSDLIEMQSRDHGSWGICITNVVDGYLIVLSPVLLVTGSAFADANTLEECFEVLRTSLDI